MADQKDKKKCAHPACGCMVTGGNKYCSEYCKDARDILELSCTCDHPECSAG